MNTKIIVIASALIVSLLILGCGVSVPEGFVKIRGGTFTMGSPPEEQVRLMDELQHEVRVVTFFMGKFEVTQREYLEIMGVNPSHFLGEYLPVENVSWFDAIEYCNRRSLREGLTPPYTITGEGNNRSVTWNSRANGYRLPTEAEWEFACRAGTTTPFSTGDNINTNQANINNLLGKTTVAGSYPPNAWGLFDMHGNVWEWCWDLYNFRYGEEPEPDRTGITSNTRAIRGGGWGSYDDVNRSARRNGDAHPALKNYNLGFRVARNIR